MCTATWILADGGYELFFNRDELVTRRPAWPPTVRSKHGVRFIAPTDPDAGGTWLAVTERGLSLGLLNGEGFVHPRLVLESRGLVILDLVDVESVDELAARVDAMEPARFKPFHLFGIESSGRAAAFQWNGERLAIERELASGSALFSSSRDPRRARAERQALLDRLRAERGAIDADELARFHASHEPERGAFSVCMHRDDASTVSFSRIRVDRDRVEFRYHAAAPCEHATLSVERIFRSMPPARVAKSKRRSRARE